MEIADVGRLVIVILIILILVTIGFVYKIITDKIFQNSISQKKLIISSGIEKKEDGDYCYINVSNRSFSNIVLASIGFKDNIKENNFIEMYKNNYMSGGQAIISSRSSIKLEIPFDEIYKLYEGFKIKKIKIYTIDSLGFKRKKSAKEIRKEIKIISKPIYDEKKRVLKEEKKQEKLARKKVENN